VREFALYANLAVLAAIVLVYGAVSGRLERSPVGGALVFMGVGYFLGPGGLGVLNLSVGASELRLLAELTLALVLFVEAADANFRVLKQSFRIPLGLLAIGLPLCIANPDGSRFARDDAGANGCGAGQSSGHQP
jgi:NhaP-type Na+/H+ or K+/H+ antiporter